MTDDLHKLLRRHLQSAGIDPATGPTPEAWAKLLPQLDRAYREADEDHVQRDRLHKELVIAQVVQTSLLPTEHEGQHFKVAATLVPADEVGGDYYDVINVGDTCWIAIGDVAGHGLRTAMIMLMVQSIVAAAVRLGHMPPSEVLTSVNRALWDNIRKRLGSDEHMTCTLLRCGPDGRVAFAGAHEEMLVCRAGGECEIIPTPGTWLGVLPDITGKNQDRELQLRPGDTIVLFTDGVTEARDAHKRQFGMERLIEVVDRHRGAPLPAIRDAIFGAVEQFRDALEDDTTVVVAAYA
ncbi:MAG TPA: PP2C family protein-serine/threonine phosphatase [Kofleriaceae bacterium]|nr:PP2C family protein-serine/threonine phosphatase [Kofleriaceae bacterium]